MDSIIAVPHLVLGFLSPLCLSLPVVRADLRMAAARFQLGKAIGIPMGVAAAAGDWNRRKNCLQHLEIRGPDWSTNRRGWFRFSEFEEHERRCDDPLCAAGVLDQSGIVDRAGVDS